MLSVGAAHGVLVAVFQYGSREGLLNFRSNGGGDWNWYLPSGSAGFPGSTAGTEPAPELAIATKKEGARKRGPLRLP